MKKYLMCSMGRRKKSMFPPDSYLTVLDFQAYPMTLIPHQELRSKSRVQKWWRKPGTLSRWLVDPAIRQKPKRKIQHSQGRRKVQAWWQQTGLEEGVESRQSEEVRRCLIQILSWRSWLVLGNFIGQEHFLFH